MKKIINTPLVSIIVPVYNVYAYLEKCLESLVNQTYKNIEIIIVNDGSTDKSDEICESFCKKDERIIVIHQVNQGLSAARNIGIDNCSGEYIMFVDSDDWVSEEIIQVLLIDIQKYNVKLSMSDYQKVHVGKEIKFPIIFNNSVTIYEKDEAIKKMLLGQWWSACSKLYHKSIFGKLRFPLGRTNEDYAIMIYVFEQCDSISYNKSKLYFYLTRPNSICTSELNIRKFDEIYNSLEVIKHVKKFHPQFQKEAEFNLGASLIKLILNIYEDKSKMFNYKLPEFKNLLNEYYRSLIKSNIMPFQQKIFLYSIQHFDVRFNTLFFKLYNFYKRLSK